MKTSSSHLVLAMALSSLNALAQSTATIDIDTSRATPLNSHFSGFNDEVVFPAEYFDYRFNNLAAQLSPGWVRYPSGIFDTNSVSTSFDQIPLADGLRRIVGYVAPFAMHAEKATCRPVRSSSARWRVIS
jgi:hypothetical protein